MLIYLFAAAQQTSTMKLPTFYLRLQTEERVLSIDKGEITRENAFHGDLCEIEDKHKKGTGEETWF